jgi:hypothetical protein
MERIGFQCEWWIPFKGICLVSERPRLTKWDDQNRLHCVNGPSVQYEDGFSIYSWHGRRVPSQWIEEKEFLTAPMALKLKNLEDRRAACEILGWEAILSELNATLIHKGECQEIGELLEVDMPDIGVERYLRVKCGTGRFFCIPVPPEMQTAHEANAWTYGLTASEYHPEVRT